jgi:hypothetical protein
LPSGNSGVCLYGGVGWVERGAFMGHLLSSARSAMMGMQRGFYLG